MGGPAGRKLRRCKALQAAERATGMVLLPPSAERNLRLVQRPRWVQPYFDKSLPDPKDLLEVSGAKVRSVTLKAASDVDHGDIQALIKAAIEHSWVSFPRTRSNRMVIKSKSRTPKKTGHA